MVDKKMSNIENSMKATLEQLEKFSKSLSGDDTGMMTKLFLNKQV